MEILANAQRMDTNVGSAADPTTGHDSARPNEVVAAEHPIVYVRGTNTDTQDAGNWDCTCSCKMRERERGERRGKDKSKKRE